MLSDLIAQNIPMGVILTQDGYICHVNEWAYKFTGYSAAEIKNKSFLDLVHPEDHEKLIARYNNIMTGKKPPEDNRYRILSKRGEMFWIRFRSKVIEYSGKPALLSFLIDETQNRIHEESLKRSEERYRGHDYKGDINVKVFENLTGKYRVYQYGYYLRFRASITSS